MKRARRWLCAVCDVTVGTVDERGDLVVTGDRRLVIPALAAGTAVVIVTCQACGSTCRWTGRPPGFETKEGDDMVRAGFEVKAVAAPALERKTGAAGGLQLKAAASGGGWEIAGYAYTWSSEPDAYGDVIERGAFKASIAKRLPKLSLEFAAPIGKTLELREDARGLYGRWSIVNTVHGTDAYKLLKHGALDALAISFAATDWERRSGGGRTVKAADLGDVALTAISTKGSGRVTAVKANNRAAETLPTLDDLQERAQRLGIATLDGSSAFGRRAARALTEQKAARASGGATARLADVDTRALVVAPIGRVDARLDLAPALGARSVLDVLPTQTTADGSVSVPSRTARSGAGPVTPGSIKPAVTLSYAGAATQLRTIAGVVETTRDVVRDGGDALAAVIDGDLRGAVRDSAEQQVVNGSGLAPELQGIRTWPGIGSLAATGTDSRAVLDALAAIASASRLRADLVLVAVTAWAAVIESLAAGGVAAELARQGVMIVSTPHLATGEALVGVAATAPVFVRDGVTVTTGHVDNQFVRNIATVLGEVDLCVVVTNPAAWVAVTGLGG